MYDDDTMIHDSELDDVVGMDDDMDMDDDTEEDTDGDDE